MGMQSVIIWCFMGENVSERDRNYAGKASASGQWVHSGFSGEALARGVSHCPEMWPRDDRMDF